MQHMSFKVVEHVYHKQKDIYPTAIGIDLGLAKAYLFDTCIKLATTKVDLVAAINDFLAVKVDFSTAKTSLARTKVE